jgi:hypothetical protein
MPLYEPRVAADTPPEQQAEAVRRAVPHVMDSLKMLKLVMCCLLMMRFYKLGQHWARVRKQNQLQRRQAAAAAAAAAAAGKKAGSGDGADGAQLGATGAGQAASKGKRA